MTYFFSTAICNDSKMKICYMFNVKLVTTNLPKKFQLVLSHSSQLGEKTHFWLLSVTSLKGEYQFYCDARIFSWLYRIKAWNDVMEVARLETLFISVNKKFEKVGLRLILLVKLTHFLSIDYSLSKVTQQSKVAPLDGTQYFGFLSESCFLSHKS